MTTASMVLGVMLVELEVAEGEGPFESFLGAAWNVARNPLPLSIALGLAVSALGVEIPVPIGKFIDLLGAVAAPCALFAIGLFLAHFPGEPLGKFELHDRRHEPFVARGDRRLEFLAGR